MSPFKKPLLNSHNQCLITEDNEKKSRPQPEASTGVISVITALTFVAMRYGKVQRHGWEKTFKTHPQANTHFSTTTKQRAGGTKGNIIYNAFIHFYLDHNYTHTSHLSTAHFSTYTTWSDHNPMLPKANSATNNPDFWSDIQINQNNLRRAHIDTLQTPPTTRCAASWNLRVVSGQHFHLLHWSTPTTVP